MRVQSSRPWLTSTGVEVPTEQLREICKSWSPETWSAYLNWYEAPCRESLFSPDLYEDLVECEALNACLKLNQSADEQAHQLCERLLSSLPANESQVLRLIYFEGRTEREIAAFQRLPKSSVHDLKNKAILRLRRGHHGDNPGTGHLMRSACASDETPTESVWAQASSSPIKEAKVYDPAQQNDAFDEIQHSALKVALGELSDRQKRIIYLRFWCDWSVAEIAREFRCGVNLVEQVLEATLSKLKRKIIALEAGYQTEGGPSCA